MRHFLNLSRGVYCPHPVSDIRYIRIQSTCFGWVRMSGPDCQLGDHPDLFEALPGEPAEVREVAA